MSDESLKNGEKTYLDENGLFKEGNPGGGRPKGSVSFKNQLDKALKSIAENSDGEFASVDEVVNAVMKKAVEEAKKGNFQYFKDIMDRTHGKAPDTIIHKGGLFSSDKLKIEIVDEPSDKQETEPSAEPTE